MASGQTKILVFDLQKNTYSCQKSKTENMVNCLENGVKLGFIPGVLGPPSEPTQKIDNPISVNIPNLPNFKGGTEIDNLSIKFLPSGKITAGSIYFIDRQNKNMGALTCTPSRVSYLRRYIYNGVNWVGL